MKKKHKANKHIEPLARLFNSYDMKFINLLNDIVMSLPTIEYKFMSIDDFGKLESIAERNYIYWIEIIQRVHLVASVSLLRMSRWLNGISIILKNNNHLAFCSCLRGLIESTADSWYTLRYVPATISENFHAIKLALEGNLNIITLCDLEDALIHYTHARKLSKPEIDDLPSTHKAKEVREYISSFQNNIISDLYSELCQYTHPSAYSVLNFILPKEDGTLILNKYSETEIYNINKLIDTYNGKITDILQIPINSSLFVFHILNMLPITELKFNMIENINIEGIPGWEKTIENIKVSEIKYNSLINRNV
ncbi:MAG: hypothetical protein AB2L13_17335 [Spirochaetota bacterium]